MKVIKFFTTIVLLSAILFSCSTPGLNTGNTGEPTQVTAANESLPTQAEIEAALASSNRVESQGYILINNEPVQVSFEKSGNVNLFEGDIILAERDIYATAEEALGLGKNGAISSSVVNTSRLWRNNTVNYIIASNVYSASNIRQAIAHIEARTDIKFINSTSSSYIEFIPSSGSWSYVGMVGGKQQIGLASWAGVGTTVHEICHALGVHHEHSRADRDNYLTIHWSNIEAGKENNFQIRNASYHKDIGPFDFGSIMLYGCFGFSINGQPTITKKDGSTYTTNRTALSPIDIQGLEYLYPGSGGGDTTPPNAPAGLSKGTVTSSSVAISWTKPYDNVGVTAYKVYVNGTYNKTVYSTSTTVSGLNANTTYRFEVTALDAATNESAKSSALSVTTADGGGTGTTTWKAYTPYNGGDKVIYDGVTYICNMAHTAYPGWEPPKVPALWRKQ